MPKSPDSLAGDLVAAVEILGEVFEKRGVRYALLGGLATNAAEIDADLIRREWAAVAEGEEQRTTWLEAELAAMPR